MIENAESIVGTPSGQIINLLSKDLYTLMKMNYIFWDGDIKEFMFYDSNLNSINKYLNKLKENDLVKIIGTNKTGVIKKIIKDYQGETIEGKDVSNIFKFGDTLYVISFINKKTGIYTEYQIEKKLISSDNFIS